jgi:GTP-binding protein LepA
VKDVGVFKPKMLSTDILESGDVGYVIANVKTTADVKIGDTLTETRKPAPEALPGYKEIHPLVFSGIYPVSTDDFEALKMAVGKLQINDSAFTYMAESSAALGFGFRCGFLGLLHMEIIQERLEREFNQTVITSVPHVSFVA